MINKNFVSTLSLSFLLSVCVATPAFALSISPSTIVVDPAVQGQKRVIEVSVGRMDASNEVKIESKITGAIADYIRVVNPESLVLAPGKSGVTIPLEVDVTGQKPGAELTGRIEFSEIGAVAKDGVPANFSNAAGNITIKVADSDAALLDISNFSTSWNARGGYIDLRFTEKNLRNFPGHISKLRYSLLAVENPGEPEVREVLIDDKDLNPGEKRDIVSKLEIDKEHVGSYTFVLEFIDEQGRVALTKDTNGMTCHYDILRRRVINSRLMYVALGALVVSGLFIFDYLYMKRKYGSKK